nr:hypothetical protein [Tanacetum cinerariifolium]
NTTPPLQRHHTTPPAPLPLRSQPPTPAAASPQPTPLDTTNTINYHSTVGTITPTTMAVHHHTTLAAIHSSRRCCSTTAPPKPPAASMAAAAATTTPTPQPAPLTQPRQQLFQPLPPSWLAVDGRKAATVTPIRGRLDMRLMAALQGRLVRCLTALYGRLVIGSWEGLVLDGQD